MNMKNLSQYIMQSNCVYLVQVQLKNCYYLDNLLDEVRIYIYCNEEMFYYIVIDFYYDYRN